MTVHEIKTTEAMVQLGAALASQVTAPAIIFLEGDLGAGKTTLARGFLQALGHPGNVKSPTYSIVEPYDLLQTRVYHFDLYRLKNIDDLEMMGFSDYLEEDAICLIEWPELIASHLRKPDIYCTIEDLDGYRRVTIK